MRVTLKVVGGKNDGRKISIAVPRFVIGRGETSHLRPASDMVSREHCTIETAGGQVIVKDLQSRNGTFVNEEKISQPHVCKTGDTIRVGRLTFEVLLDPVKPSVKNPKVKSVVEAASRTVTDQSKKSSIEDSITDWLAEGDDDDDVFSDSREREKIANAETIQLNLEDTTKIRDKKMEDVSVTEEEPKKGSAKDSGKNDSKMFGRKKKEKAVPMKLPHREKEKLEDSTAAADDVLRKFFNRR